MGNVSAGGAVTFNLSKLLESLDQDPVVLQEVLALFVDQSHRLVAGLEKAREERNLEDLILNAHTLKGSLLQISAHPTAHLAERVELMARRGQWEEMNEACSALKEGLLTVQREIASLST